MIGLQFNVAKKMAGNVVCLMFSWIKPAFPAQMCCVISPDLETLVAKWKYVAFVCCSGQRGHWQVAGPESLYTLILP
jgi:hypothetical protein